MPAQSGLGFSGIVAINIPVGGATGEVLTKQSGDNYDYDWQAGGGGTVNNLQDAYDGAPAPPQITVNAGQPVTIDIPAASNNSFQLRDELNNVVLRVGNTDDSLLELTSTSQGFRIMQMTTAQRTALTNLAGLLVYDTDLGQLHQNDGAGWSIPGAGLTDLQTAYNNNPAGAQIVLDAVPNPLALQASVAGNIFEIQDLGATLIFEFSDTQMAVRAPILFDVDLDNFLPANPTALFWNTNFTMTNALIGGFIGSVGTTTLQNGTFIWGLLGEQRQYVTDVALGFAAYTFINALPSFNTASNNTALAALIMNVGVQHIRNTSGTTTTGGVNGINFAPSLRTTAFGAIVTSTGYNIAVCQPGWSTVFGSTINLGTVVGLRLNQPAQALFGTSAGTENITAYYGIQAWETDNTFGGANRIVEVIRSGLSDATNTRLIRNLSTAQSDFGSGSIHLNAGTLIKLGGTVASPSASIQWNNATSSVLFAFAGTLDQLQWRNPAAGRIQLTQATDLEEFTFSCARFSFGAQTGANGNQVGNFVTPARTLTVAGDWADFLLTQANNLTVNGLAMGRISAWVINPVSYANSTGSVTNADTLTVGGFPTSSPGVTITNRHSLNVIGGRSRLASAMQYPPISPAALAAGDNDDWNGLLTGSLSNSMRHWARITGNATTSVLTGIDSSNAQSGDSFQLTNVGTDTIILNNEDTASLAANRIITPTGRNFVLRPDNSVEVRYDTADSRWRIVSAQVNSGTLSGEWQFDNTTTMADPGNGNFRNNNATIGSVTAIAIADETKTGGDAGGILSAIASGDQFYIQSIEDSDEFLVFDITSNTDNTGWHQIGGTVNASGNNFTDGKEFLITVIFA